MPSTRMEINYNQYEYAATEINIIHIHILDMKQQALIEIQFEIHS